MDHVPANPFNLYVTITGPHVTRPPRTDISLDYYLLPSFSVSYKFEYILNLCMQYRCDENIRDPEPAAVSLYYVFYPFKIKSQYLNYCSNSQRDV